MSLENSLYAHDRRALVLTTDQRYVCDVFKPKMGKTAWKMLAAGLEHYFVGRVILKRPNVGFWLPCTMQSCTRAKNRFQWQSVVGLLRTTMAVFRLFCGVGVDSSCGNEGVSVHRKMLPVGIMSDIFTGLI